MLDLRDIRDDGHEWLDLFNAFSTTYQTLVDIHLTQNCDELGFDDELGQKVIQKRGLDNISYDELYEKLSEMDDVAEVGAAFFAHWLSCRRHFARTKIPTIETKHRDWFRLVVSRLVFLAEKYPDFEGEPQKLQLVTTRREARLDRPTFVIEQHLTLLSDGRYWSSTVEKNVFHGKNVGGVKKTHKAQTTIGKDNAVELFSALLNYLYAPDVDQDKTTSSDWQASITNDAGEVVNFDSAVKEKGEQATQEITQAFREVLHLPTYYFFDATDRTDKIVGLQCWLSKKADVDEAGNIVNEAISETLEVDRYSGAFTYKVAIGSAKMTQQYQLKDEVGTFLDQFNAQTLFAELPEKVADEEEDESAPIYHFTVEIAGQESRMISQRFNREGLPKDWAAFSQAVSEFLRINLVGPFFNPKYFRQSNRMQKDFIVCSVAFGDGKKTYDYLTYDESIQVGDLVAVPVGSDNHLAAVNVTAVNYFTEEELPIPLAKLKQVVRKLSIDDLD